MNFGLALLLMAAQVQTCDNACLAAAVKRLEATVQVQNQLLERLMAPPPQPKHPRLALVIKVANQAAVIALPILVKTIQNGTTVKAVPVK